MTLSPLQLDVNCPVFTISIALNLTPAPKCWLRSFMWL